MTVSSDPSDPGRAARKLRNRKDGTPRGGPFHPVPGFAGGLLLGVGAIFVMLFNGSFFGAIAGHLINTGGHEAFFTFVIAHGAPELTAIVLAGGAGLRLGWSIIAPGQWSRLDALRLAARDALPTMYGVFALLLLAAFIEAFWSPRDFEATIKYSVGAACWALLYLYLFFQDILFLHSPNFLMKASVYLFPLLILRSSTLHTKIFGLNDNNPL